MGTNTFVEKFSLRRCVEIAVQINGFIQTLNIVVGGWSPFNQLKSWFREKKGSHLFSAYAYFPQKSGKKPWSVPYFPRYIFRLPYYDKRITVRA